MATLKETKGRISSVKGTLKITSAMKLVSSAKMLSAQKAALSIQPYSRALSSMLASLLYAGGSPSGEVLPENRFTKAGSSAGSTDTENDWFLKTREFGNQKQFADNRFTETPVFENENASDANRFSKKGHFENEIHTDANRYRKSGVYENRMESGKAPEPKKPAAPAPTQAPEPSPSPDSGKKQVAIIAIASNSSLCGAFNANAVKEVLNYITAHPDEEVTVFSAGRKMADAMRRVDHISPIDLNSLSGKPTYEPAAELADGMLDAFTRGHFEEVLLVYNKFVSSSRQEVVTRTLLPFRNDEPEAHTGVYDYIVEPDSEQALDSLLPMTIKVKLYAAFLSSSAAEHAARLIAMQTATDNGDELLRELTLEYNKARQMKITSEILDLVSGAAQ